MRILTAIRCGECKLRLRTQNPFTIEKSWIIQAHNEKANQTLHRGHFGSRYKLGCCRYAGLFFFFLCCVLSKQSIFTPANAHKAHDVAISHRRLLVNLQNAGSFAAKLGVQVVHQTVPQQCCQHTHWSSSSSFDSAAYRFVPSAKSIAQCSLPSVPG